MKGENCEKYKKTEGGRIETARDFSVIVNPYLWTDLRMVMTYLSQQNIQLDPLYLYLIKLHYISYLLKAQKLLLGS